jgi:basic membrane protein A and related proteins
MFDRTSKGRAARVVMAAALLVSAVVVGATSAASDKRVGVAQPSSKNDHSFSQAVHEGSVQAQKAFGFKLNEIYNVTTPKAQATAVTNLARTNDIVLVAGAISISPMYKKFPNTQFVLIDGIAPKAPNTFSVTQDWYPVGYLAGVAAAKATKTNTVGFVGGIPIPVITDGAKAFALGAKSVNPNIKVLTTTIGSFTDSVKAKSAAAAQVASGADVIWADLDTAHAGVVQAIQDSGKGWVIGSVAPKCSISSGVDLGDTTFNLKQIVFNTLKEWNSGSLAKLRIFSAKDGSSISDMTFCSKAPASVKSAVAKAKADILSGKVKLP